MVGERSKEDNLLVGGKREEGYGKAGERRDRV